MVNCNITNDLIVDEYRNKRWYKDGLLHREDGPACEYSDGIKYWYYYGEYINCNSQEEFERIIKIKAFI